MKYLYQEYAGYAKLEVLRAIRIPCQSLAISVSEEVVTLLGAMSG